MCTVVLSWEPEARTPLLLLAVRDEHLGRPWLPPARHWPDHPDLVGGLDLLAGGTWLAADPAARGIRCVLNGHGERAPAEGRRSRGQLPLDGAPADLGGFDPFHLLDVTLTGAALTSWDGAHRTSRRLEPGLTVVVNGGLDPASPRGRRLQDLLSTVDRPDPGDREPAGAWGAWWAVAAGVGIAREDPEAVILRYGTEYGSSSVSLLAVGPAGLRYDFGAVPVEPGPLADVVRVV